MSKLTLKLAQIVQRTSGPHGERRPFLDAFRKLRTLGLPCAYELALCAGTIDTHVQAYTEAHQALVQRLGAEYETGKPGEDGYEKGVRVKPENLAEFVAALKVIEEKTVELPVTAKLKLGQLAGALSADDLIPLLDLVAP